MKKFLSSILALATGGLTFLWLSLAHVANDYASANGWDYIQLDPLIPPDGLGLYKVGAIGMIVLASLLIIMGVILLLNCLGIIKTDLKLNMFNNFLLLVNAVFVVLALIGMFIIIGEAEVSVGIGLWLALAVGIVACVLGFLFGKDAKSKKKSKR
ncbi:MAG: hypothetical protein J6C90_03510 [Clostridia bacterium]|nr:hypothetical protein [Clostridia bacterium]